MRADLSPWVGMADRRARLGPAFGALWVGSGVSNLGDGMRMAALPLLAVQLTTSPLLIAGIATAQYLPWLLFAPIGGALVDRYPRRRTIVVTQAGRGVVEGALALLVLADVVAIWQLYVVSMLLTAGEILVDPAVGALVPTVVDDTQLDVANGRISGTEVLTNEFAGQPLGSALFAAARWIPFAFDAITYVGSIGAFRRLPRVDVHVDPQRNRVRADIAEGVRWLRHHEVLGPLTLAIGCFYFGAVAGFSLLVLLVTDVLHGGELAFGLTLAVGALGAVLGSFVAARLVTRLGRRRLMVVAMGAQAALLAATACAPNVGLLMIISFVAGVPAGMWMPISRALQQRLTLNRLLGRVNVTGRILTRGSMVGGSLFCGAIAAFASVRAAIGVGAAIQAIAVGLVWWALRGHDLEQPRSAGTQPD